MSGRLYTLFQKIGNKLSTFASDIADLTNGKRNAGNGTSTQSDMNNITESGCYWINNNTTTTNMPRNIAGALVVERSHGVDAGNILQTFYPYNAGTIYRRVYTNSQWYAWKGEFINNNTAVGKNGYTISTQYIRRVDDIVYARILGKASSAITSTSTVLAELPYNNVGILSAYVTWKGQSFPRVGLSGKNLTQSISTSIVANDTLDFQLIYVTHDGY